MWRDKSLPVLWCRTAGCRNNAFLVYHQLSELRYVMNMLSNHTILGTSHHFVIVVKVFSQACNAMVPVDAMPPMMAMIFSSTALVIRAGNSSCTTKVLRHTTIRYYHDTLSALLYLGAAKFSIAL